MWVEILAITWFYGKNQFVSVNHYLLIQPAPQPQKKEKLPSVATQESVIYPWAFIRVTPHFILEKLCPFSWKLQFLDALWLQWFEALDFATFSLLRQHKEHL